MKKIIRLTESDLTRIVRRIIKESDESEFFPITGIHLKKQELSTITPPYQQRNNSKFWEVEYREHDSNRVHTKLFDTEEEAIEFDKIKNFRAKRIVLEVLPKFWESIGVKRAESSFADESGQSSLTRDNTIALTVDGDPVDIYRRDTKIYNDRGQKAGRDEDSIFYNLEISRTTDDALIYAVSFQDNKDAKLGGYMNLKYIGQGEFKSEEVGSIDNRGFFKIVEVK